jgi:hypothetical protein
LRGCLEWKTALRERRPYEEAGRRKRCRANF